MVPCIVGENVDSWIHNVRGELSEEVIRQLDHVKAEAQALEDDVLTPWRFCGEALFNKSHGAGRQWRWIRQCPSLHLELGPGKRTGRVGKARLSAACLWEHGPIEALPLLYAFLVNLLGSERFALQVSEVHRCVDVAGNPPWRMRVPSSPEGIAGAYVRKGWVMVTRMMTELATMARWPRGQRRHAWKSA
jgi:hypothetical protein